MAPAGGQAPGLPPIGDPTNPLEIMLNTPALRPPEGIVVEMTLDGPDQVWFLVVAILCTAVPGIFLILRVYTKLAISRGFELADYFIFLAFPLMVVEIANGYLMVKWGAGVHQWQVTFRQLFNQLYYLRVFAPTRQLNRLMWYGACTTIAACFIFYTVFTFWTMFYCKPRTMIWNKFTPDGKCHDHGPIVISQGIFNMASDVIILLLPTRSLWQLRVPLARKLVITSLFATGLLACVASVMRIVFTIKIAPIFTESDISHNGLLIGLWTQAEVALGFIVACSLSLPKLVQAKRKKISQAMSKVSSPFSSIRSTIRSRSGSQSTKRSNSTSDGSRKGSLPLIVMQSEAGGIKRPIYYEERELRAQHEKGMFPIKEERDPYPLPSEAGSTYSPSIHSPRSSTSSDDPTLHVAPLNWMNKGAPRNLGVLPPAPDSVDGTEGPLHEIATLPPVLNGMNAGGERASHRLTQKELFVLQQFNFERFSDSVDIERTADLALKGR
ncbi:hypothetical protein BU24DRAFT_408037 [Aaosphaeria arxii CBS 175.79]|uniref:Rhodopsin domain-containing protein n=1 Tax=Aaosphaeria arxii CBS 175.79 TaxID=1450172 RepID=A0A6A5Y0K2_9PLEO|nr:uncharacterized protein BU24DRAFT_408037 [Aaosphaeria arxii CBS 175.79]KAF2018084.1 hypothetical protein BU24DRAFT_408037 [Aaosphaeria arxii CBS 175.79]